MVFDDKDRILQGVWRSRVSCAVVEWNGLVDKFWPAGFATNKFWRGCEGWVIGGVESANAGLKFMLKFPSGSSSGRFHFASTECLW